MPRRRGQSAGENSQKAICECKFLCRGIGPTGYVRGSATTVSMTAADRVAGILRKTGRLRICALIGRHRLINLAVRLLNKPRTNRSWLA